MANEESFPKYPEYYKEWISNLRNGIKHDEKDIKKAKETIEKYMKAEELISNDTRKWFKEFKEEFKKDSIFFKSILNENIKKKESIINEKVKFMFKYEITMSEEMKKVTLEWGNKMIEIVKKEELISFEENYKKLYQDDSILDPPKELLEHIIIYNRICIFWEKLIHQEEEKRISFLNNNEPKTIVLITYINSEIESEILIVNVELK